MSRELEVAEIFKSIQGEGANTGMSCIFVRLSGCNLSCDFCDTKWDEGESMTPKQILSRVKELDSNNIVWTGGEPTLQLTKEVLDLFSEFYNCIETNGTNPIPEGIDYISLSPKNAPIHESIKGVHEIRMPIASGDAVPDIFTLPASTHYYLSPVFDDEKINIDNLQHCLKIIGENEIWKLSIQTHKLLNIK